jgi:hypothetical protein
MMRKNKTKYLSLLLMSLIFSCTDSSVKKQNSGNVGQVKSYHKPPASFTDTIMIEYPAAVFYNPDSLQLQKIKNAMNAMDFEGTMHECFYQQRNARRVIREQYPNIKIIETTKARYLLFKIKGTTLELIDLDTKNEPCGMIVFDGKKKPIPVDMTNVDTQLGFYFSK